MSQHDEPYGLRDIAEQIFANTVTMRARIRGVRLEVFCGSSFPMTARIEQTNARRGAYLAVDITDYLFDELRTLGAEFTQAWITARLRHGRFGRTVNRKAFLKR